MRFIVVHNQKMICILLITLTEVIKMLNSLQWNSIIWIVCFQCSEQHVIIDIIVEMNAQKIDFSQYDHWWYIFFNFVNTLNFSAWFSVIQILHINSSDRISSDYSINSCYVHLIVDFNKISCIIICYIVSLN